MPPTPPLSLAGGAEVLPMLKRFDGDVEEVLASSGHVALYHMTLESQQWMRKDVEGSLFLLKRRGTPRFQIMVLNKMSTENYTADLTVPGLDFEVNPPYLMYTHGNKEIMGLWFFEAEDLQRVDDVLKRILQQVQQAAAPAQSPAVQRPARQAPQHGREDDGFWDKAPAAANPNPDVRMAVNPQQQTLQELFRKAGRGQAQAAPPPPPQAPLPPSFFAQQNQQQQQQQAAQRSPPPSIVAPAVQAPPPQAPPQAVASPHGVIPHAAAGQPAAFQPPPPQAQLQQGAAPMGGALGKLFANAHKPPGVVPGAAVAPQQPAAAAVMPTHAPQPAQPPPPAAVAPAPAGVSDEERVRRLLSRIATNDALVRMLAAEMKAVGLL